LPPQPADPARDRNGTGLPPPYDRFDLSGRVALVTGGTRGLGRAIIRTLAQAGADLVVSSRKQEACDDAAREVRGLGRKALPHVCHIGRWNEIDALVEAAYAEFGHVDVLVNNAGGQHLMAAEEITPKGCRTAMRLNAESAWLMTHSVATRRCAPPAAARSST
jgi:NAD(P)-dependent dehydrogenase (short-subunit alcohol dehydrogenase family)